MEKVRKTRWTANLSLCWWTLLHHILGAHEIAAPIAGARKSTGSDERAALDQALLLVEILKSEYSRVLRENEKLQGRTKLHAIDTQTCATTAEKPSQVSLARTLQDNVAPPHSPATPFSNWNAQRGLNGFRRQRRWRPPASFYYYDVPFRRLYDSRDYFGANIGTVKWRRFNYDEDFGPQPGNNKTTTSTKTTTTTKTSSKKQTTAASTAKTKNTAYIEVPESSFTSVGGGSTNVSNEIVTKPGISGPTSEKTDNLLITEDTVYTNPSQLSSSQYTAQKSKIETIGNHSSPRPLRKKPLPLPRNTKGNGIPTTRVREPELSQAAEELVKELGAVATPGSFGHRFSILWRGSTKAYLADSTRYPVPLPQNHAFCFTNPHNALCRTFI
ncbi:uncharacterized protein LOC120636521 [Pararge aegeria]|uniref:uncharacterized protein LOC120636521 n=1 Tax=Pararge aegeria TaxID=116150 RepID=UPI0019D20D83|nr:uncharacterized protein LOC120636521 [Pararge aegeria]